LESLDQDLGELIEYAQARTKNIDKLSQLEGRLEFVVAQMKMRGKPLEFGAQKPDYCYVGEFILTL
jgi:hypothetical protein